MIHHLPNRRLFVKHTALSGSWLWAAGRCPFADAQDAAALSQAEFEKLYRELQPPSGEPWRAIPWKMSIVDACRLAAKEKKPLVMRVRSGHPLGCV